MNIVRTVARKFSNRLKNVAGWKLSAAYENPTNLNVKLSTKLGGQAGGQPKIWGSHGLPRPHLRTATERSSSNNLLQKGLGDLYRDIAPVSEQSLLDFARLHGFWLFSSEVFQIKLLQGAIPNYWLIQQSWGHVGIKDQCELTLWEPAYDIFVLRFRPKNSSFRLPYQRPSSSADCARSCSMAQTDRPV